MFLRSLSSHLQVTKGNFDKFNSPLEFQWFVLRNKFLEIPLNQGEMFLER